jgi:hypothetical protein
MSYMVLLLAVESKGERNFAALYTIGLFSNDPTKAVGYRIFLG